MNEILLIDNAQVSLDRKLDGKGRVMLPGDLREAIGMDPDAEIEIRLASVQKMEGGIQKAVPAFIITKKEEEKRDGDIRDDR